MASVHLVKRSEMTKIYLFPCFVSGSGPNISTATLSIDSPEMYVPSGVLFVSCFGSYAKHRSHERQYFCAYSFILGQ